MKRTRLMMRISLVLLCLQSINTVASGWTGATKIKQLYFVANTQLLIKLEDFNNPTNCDVNSSGHILIDPTTQEGIYSLILSAYMAQKKVNVYVSGSCKKTHWATPSFGALGHVKVHD